MIKKVYSYVRFSKGEQKRGRSYDRQVDLARKYAEKNGWELDETTEYYDPGKSGFHGIHVKRGSLGKFLSLVEAGEIPKGSVLLVENLDRLSRENVLDAADQFLAIIRAGIAIHTLEPEMQYSPQLLKDDIGRIYIAIGSMHRAHDESKRKSERRKDVWANGRNLARERGYKIPARCPAWLKWNKDKTDFVLRQDRVEVVNKIYDLYISGMGVETIAKTLHAEGAPTWQNKTLRWSNSTILRILSSRTVLGEIEFKSTVGFNDRGHRIEEPVGEVIKGYYPQVVSNEKFAACQEQRRLRKGKFGKIGEMKNLFSKLAKCGYCGATMQYHKNGRNGRHKYLSCRNGRLGVCKTPFASFRYEDFETAFLDHCHKLKLPDVIKDDLTEHEKQIKILQGELLAVKDSLTQSEKKVDNFTAAIGQGASEDTVQHFMSLINKEHEDQRGYRESKEQLELEINRLMLLHEETGTSLVSLKEAISKFNKAKDEDRIELRRKVQKKIRELVERIDFYPLGKSYLMLNELINNEEVPYDIRQDFEWRTNLRTARMFRSCRVYFRGGGTLSFGHKDEITLQVTSEIDEHGELTQRSRGVFEQFFREALGN